MNNQQSGGQQPCCGGGECCPPGGTTEGRNSNRWKTMIFAAVMLLAGTVAVYSLFWRGPSDINSACCPSGSAGCAIPCVTDTAIAGFDDELAGAEFAIAVFLPAGCVFPQHVADVLHGVITDLAATGTHVQTLYLTPADPAFTNAVSRYKISACPTVLVSAKELRVVLDQGAISRDSILSIHARSRHAASHNAVSDPAEER